MLNSRVSAVASADGALIDALCDDYEAALNAHHNPRIEAFLEKLGEDLRPAAFRELLRVDVELRRTRGELVSASDYRNRFPAYERAIEAVFHSSDVVPATAAFIPAQIRDEADLDTKSQHDTGTGRGQLEVRCPHCHASMAVAVDTALTSLTCGGCGSEFSLVNGQDAADAAPLATMGRFELISRLGMGAFGAVWKARDKELDRVVAVKIPRAGAMTAEEQEKFFREARAAAQLRHPNIVSVHEVGRDGESVYIVSDFVQGMTLSDWLAGQQLTSREAASLCAKIADALEHAHEQGIIHRDLKPANIMIDAAGQPHLMDFGLARREVGEVTMTMEGHVLGTPAYMSPEQAQGDSHKADRRSDVYSLGVILFQLLTRELPFRGNVRMVLQQVIHDEPPSPRKLNANISKDLETITLKCLEKDPHRRYPSTAAVAAELRRYLSGEPILARPVSRAERTVRWVRRNKTVSAMAAAVAVALIAGTIVSTYFAVDARRQASAAIARKNETTAVLGFVEDKVFAAARPKGLDGGLGHNVSLRQAIESALPSVQSSFATQPLIEARLRSTLGISFSYLGDATTAAQQFETARDLRMDQIGPDHPDTLGSMYNLATAYHSAGRIEDAILLYEKTLAAAQKHLGADHAQSLALMNGLAVAYDSAGRIDDALALHEQTFAAHQKKQGADDPDTLASMANLAGAYFRAGRMVDAMPLYEQNLAARRKKLGAAHPDTLVSINNLAEAYRVAGRLDDAGALYEQTLDTMRETLGADHPITLTAMNNLGERFRAAGRLDEAIALFEQALGTQRKKLDVDHPHTLNSMNGLAAAYFTAGRLSDAVPLFEQSLAARRKKLGDEHPDTLMSMNNLAAAYGTAGRLVEAVPLFEQTLAAKQKKLGLDHPETLESMNNLAIAYFSTNHLHKALPLFKQSLEAKRKKLGPDHPQTLASMNGLAGAYLATDRVQDAIPLFEDALAAAKRKGIGAENQDIFALINNLAIAYRAADRPSDAIKLCEQSLDATRKKLGAEHPTTLSLANTLANAYLKANRLDEAIPLYEQAIAARQKKLGNDHADTLKSMNELADALNEQAWNLATSPSNEIRNGKRSLELATKACTLTNYESPGLLDTLAAAYAETGDFDSAIKWSQKALDLIDPDGEPELREQFTKALDNYKAKKPTRQSSQQDSNAKTNDQALQRSMNSALRR